MSPEEIQSELRECLKLQEELAARRDELTRKFKAILELERARGNNGRVIADIDGEIYELGRRDDSVQDEVVDARKFGGFYAQYRLIKLGRPI
jgi:hypothetical protein